MGVEVELVIFFLRGEEGEWPDQYELEAAIQRRYPNAEVIGYEEQEV